MSTYARNVRRETGENRTSYQAHHRHDYKNDPRRYRKEVIDVDRRHTDGEKKFRAKRKQQQNQEGQTAKLATIALAMGIGFGVGLMYSRSKKTKNKLQNEVTPYRIESQIEGYEDRARPEYRRLDDRLSYREESTVGY